MSDRRRTEPSGPRRAATVAVACVLAAFVVPAFAQGWPITQFEVLPVEPGRHLEVPGDNPVAAYVEFFLEGFFEIAQDSGAFDPDLPEWFETVDVDADLEREIIKIEYLLNSSARRLEQWGFRPPALVPVVDTPDGGQAYRVYLVKSLVGDFGSDGGRAGVFHGSLGGGLIMLSAENVLSNGRLSDRGAFTVVHELFHAVQFGSPFFDPRPDGTVGDWITEGTANAVAVELVRLLWNDEPAIGPRRLHGQRAYSLPLPRIDESPGQPESYDTSSFWRYLAEAAAIGSPGPAPAPADFSVLARMFEVGPVGRECHDNPIDCASELTWLDLHLRTLFGKPLREMYALFVQAYAQYGTPWGRLPEPTDTWLSYSFTPCDPVVFRKDDEPDPGGATGIVHHSVLVTNRVGTACFVVTPRGYADDVRVVVRVDDPTGELPLEDLTAGVEGEPMVAVAADVEAVGADRRARTAAWTFDFQVDETTAFFLTNVADEPSATTNIFDLPVTFTVVEEYAGMVASAGGAAVAPSLVFEALPFEFGRVRQADVIPGRNEVQERAGLIDPCAVRFVVTNPETGDALEIALDHEGPIVPGTFDIALLAEGRFEPPEAHAGAAVIGFGIGAANPLSQGDAQAYGGQVGTLTFDAFTRDVVQGSLTVLGKRSIDGRYVGDDWRAYPEELETVAVTAAFRLVPRLPANPLGLLSIESCLHPDPARRVAPVPVGGDPVEPLPRPVPPGGPELPADEGGAAAEDDEREAPEAASPEAAESEEAPGAPAVDGSVLPLECQPYAFARGVEFDANPDLPFVFEHPEGWVHTRITEGARARGTFVPPVPTSGAIEYSAERLLTDREVALADLVRSAFEELAVVDFGGEAIVVRGGAMGATLVAAFAVPIEGGVVSVQVLFMAPRGCDGVLTEALRELFLQTLRPRP